MAHNEPATITDVYAGVLEQLAKSRALRKEVLLLVTLPGEFSPPGDSSNPVYQNNNGTNTGILVYCGINTNHRHSFYFVPGSSDEMSAESLRQTAREISAHSRDMDLGFSTNRYHRPFIAEEDKPKPRVSNSRWGSGRY